MHVLDRAGCGAVERQRDIRAGRSRRPVAAPRRLLPVHDEGIDLRVRWLDHAGYARWEFATSHSSSEGDHVLGVSGPAHRAVFRLPPAFDRLSLVLAWREIGFPETVISLPLPDRAAVAGAGVSIWQAPLEVHPVPAGLAHLAERGLAPPAIEAGAAAASPRVLHRGDHRGAVVLNRLTAADSALCAEAVNVHAFAPEHLVVTALDDPARIRTAGPGASVAVLERERGSLDPAE
ncbi:hypothetical protein [Amycolatopsis magusensis]|uniref:hypothetical protein n=1 Tax=Amycolatopsis magusensis TaxID=882444 RepID=UPI0024A7B245|nr:hypothetical protein [Amycolatopsis magusensis]MDI5982156.1 hypothetical protein [Amycolatopsis magusensis]